MMMHNLYNPYLIPDKGTDAKENVNWDAILDTSLDINVGMGVLLRVTSGRCGHCWLRLKFLVMIWPFENGINVQIIHLNM